MTNLLDTIRVVRNKMLRTLLLRIQPLVALLREFRPWHLPIMGILEKI